MIDLTAFPNSKKFHGRSELRDGLFCSRRGSCFDLPVDVQCGDVIGADGALYRPVLRWWCPISSVLATVKP
jgi:hypothetical protein